MKVKIISCAFNHAFATKKGIWRRKKKKKFELIVMTSKSCIDAKVTIFKWIFEKAFMKYIMYSKVFFRKIWLRRWYIFIS